MGNLIHNKALAIGAILLISACSTQGRFSGNRLTNSVPDLSPKSIQTGTGIIERGAFKAIVARPGDTLASMAARAGTSPETLAKFNGLPLNYLPKTNEQLAIPTTANTVVSSPIPSETPNNAIDGFGEDAESTIRSTSLGTNNNGSANTHRVLAGETVYSISRLYNVSASELAKANNLSGNLVISPGQELVIPSGNGATASKPIPAPVSSTPAPTSSTGGAFAQPVSGSVVSHYNPSKDQDGLIYQTGQQSEVRASAGGKVVLVSESTGSQGTIVMVQHPNGLISIYGRMGSTRVTKGQQVSAGQVLGTTANNELMFQLRRGTASLNPVDYF